MNRPPTIRIVGDNGNEAQAIHANSDLNRWQAATPNARTGQATRHD